MRLWLRVHQAGRVAVVLIATMAAVAVVGGRAVPLPSIARGALASTPVALVFPLVSAAVLVRGLGAGPVESESVAGRPLRAFQTLFVAAVCGTALACGWLLTASGVQELGFAAARDLAGFAGLGLVGGRLMGRDAATVLPTAYLFGVVMVGAPQSRVPPWLWPVGDSRDVLALALAVLSLGVGLSLPASRVRRKGFFAGRLRAQRGPGPFHW